MRASFDNFRLLKAATVGLVCTAALAIGLTMWWLHAKAVADVVNDTGNLATVLADQLDRSVQSIDFMINELQERIDDRGARTKNDFRRVLQGEDIHQLLTDRKARVSNIDVISLTDRNGLLVSSTNRWPLPPTDLSDRENFQYLKKNDGRQLFITKPIRDRVAGLSTVFFSKRIEDAKGEFLGMISIGVRLSYFRHIYELIASLHDLSLVFLRNDGTVIVRYPDPTLRFGDKLPAEVPWYRLVSQGGGYFRSPGVFDNEARLISVRLLRSYPLVVNVGISEAAALKTWRLQAITSRHRHVAPCALCGIPPQIPQQAI